MIRRHSSAVVGLGYSRVMRHAEVPLGVLAAEAARAAAQDAGISVAEIDGVMSVCSIPFDVDGPPRDGRHFISADLLSRQLRLRPAWGANSTRMVGPSFIEAVRAVEAGASEYTLVVRALHSPPGAYGRTTTTGAPGPAQFTAPYGLFAPALFAHAWHRYRDVYGSGTREQMATFVLQARRNGLLNPDSYWRQHRPVELTLEDYLNARMISTPLSLYDCDLPLQGAGAFVITRSERALVSERPAAYVHGVSSPFHPGSEPPLFPLEREEAAGRHIAGRLWADSGLAPADVDVANLYDGFSILAIEWLEAMGFCGPGEGFDFIQNGRIARDGELPLNTGGGNLGAGRMHGVPQLMDSARQVMGTAGPAQVTGARVALATVGPPSIGAAVLFGSEPH